MNGPLDPEPTDAEPTDTAPTGTALMDNAPTAAADFYTGIVAEVYDALRSTSFGAERYLDFVRRVGEPALELGCGDEGPFLELAAQGIDIEGVDSSQDMLDRCAVHAAARGFTVITHCQPMESLALQRRYRSIYLAGPTFNLVPDDELAGRALGRIAAHLEPGGEVLVPLWIPAATPSEQFGQTRTATTSDGATARYIVDSECYDTAARTRSTSTTYELDDGVRTTRVDREWIIHWHTPEGFDALSRSAGLAAEISPVENGEFTALLRHAGAGFS
ncbi:class I SAM-dependent methyltransferase [Nakamurella sp. A5-74]|uniref:Class I SAM-dependent methyltransferase n=1 Tax=Nakamurella sp. A5-74 TaxID=3158264 RepID=A0AAU8DVQ9_9ACTN